MSSFRGLSVGNGNGGDSLSLTVPLTPHVGLGTPTITAANSGPAEVRLAGVDTKEKMYEPKQRKKLVRVLTVVAYLFFVSLAAAMLSLYYVFLWNPSPKALTRQLTDEQLRLQEQATLRELQRIQEQRRANEQLRLQEQSQRDREAEQQQQQRLSLQLLQQQAWISTLSPDYPDFTENAEDDELYTMEPPPPLPVLRHHGAAAVAAGAEDADNAIPQVSLSVVHSRSAHAAAAPSSPSMSLGQVQGAAEAAAGADGDGGPRAFGSYAALRHSSLRSLRGPRLGQGAMAD